MIHKIIRAGFMSNKDRTFTTQIEMMPEEGSLYAFYIDANYNIVKPYHYIKAVIQRFKFTKDNFSVGFMSEIVRAIDEDAISKDYVSKAFLLCWVLDGKKLLVNVGATFKCHCIDHLAWEDEIITPACNFTHNGGNYHYIGSGAALGAVEEFSEEEDILAFTEDTQFHYSQSLHINLVSQDNLPTERGDYETMFNKAFWSAKLLKNRPSKDIFIAVFSK